MLQLRDAAVQSYYCLGSCGLGILQLRDVAVKRCYCLGRLWVEDSAAWGCFEFEDAIAWGCCSLELLLLGMPQLGNAAALG